MTEPLREQLQASLDGNYTLERELGGGGMSRVFLAEELRLKRRVVIKVLSPEMAQGISVERFEREIRTAASLQQANIVGVLSAGETDGLPYYTMPYVEGESLRARVARGPLSIAEGVAVLRDVTRALAYAHQRGVVHRDIKPDNVLMSGGAAMVADFGIAKAISVARTGAGGATLTQTGITVGTPAYMAPEQAAGDPEIDHRADIYGLGAMAYELFTGQTVFPYGTAQRMLAAHIGEIPKPIRAIRPDLPDAIAQLVMRCLAKNPDDRPQSAIEIARVLDVVASDSTMHAVRLGGPGMFKNALATYVVSFITVALLARVAISGIGLPDWVFPGALIVMALGFPVVLWTGYVHRVAHRALTQTPTYTPGGSPTVAGGAIATLALKAAPKTSWYRTARGGAYAMATFVVMIIAFLTMRAIGIGPFGSLVASGKLKAKEPLLLTDFRVVNADSTLGRVVSDAVRAGLAESSVLSLVPAARISDALRRMQRDADSRLDLALARDLATREGIKAVVDGDITGVGASYIVQLRLVSTDSGAELASFRETGDGPRGLIDAADKLARALRAKAGESLRAVQGSRPLAEVTTGSLEALKKYTQALRATHDERFDDAVKLARESIALDTTFALAYRHLSEALVNGPGRGPASDSAIAKAFQWRDRLTERERLAVLGDYYGNGPGRDRGKAIDAFERQIALGDYSNTNSLGLLLDSRREYARAESLATVRTQIEPEGVVTYSNANLFQYRQGKIAAMESSLSVLRRLAPRSPDVADGLMNLALARDSLDRAASIADSMRRAGEDGTRWTRQLAMLAVLRGRLTENDRLTQEAAREDSAHRHPERALIDSLDQIRRDAELFGPARPLVRRTDAVAGSARFSALSRTTLHLVRTVPLLETQPYLEAAQTYALAGDPDRAREMLTRFDAEVRDTVTVRNAQSARHTALGFIALAENRPRDAVVEFRQGDLADDGPANPCDACLPSYLALAFDEMREPDSTIAQLERFREATSRGRILKLAVMVPLAESRLGELYEAKGDKLRAAERYRRFLDLWRNADAPLQPKVKDTADSNS